MERRAASPPSAPGPVGVRRRGGSISAKDRKDFCPMKNECVISNLWPAPAAPRGRA